MFIQSVELLDATEAVNISAPASLCLCACQPLCLCATNILLSVGSLHHNKLFLQIISTCDERDNEGLLF